MVRGYLALFVGLLIILFSCKDYKQESKNVGIKNNLVGYVYAPTNIKWDTIPDGFGDGLDLLHSNFPIIFFKNDTTVYLIKSLNELESDSILIAVDNVELFLGKCTINVNSAITSFTRKSKFADINSIQDSFTDTMNLSFKDTLTFIYYRGLEYSTKISLMKESYMRLEKLTTN